jgi:hypothetical protein
MDAHNGQNYFRLIGADANMDHSERMSYFNDEINGSNPQFTITAYEIDMDGGEMLECGITSHVFQETYWDRSIQGAV